MADAQFNDDELNEDNERFHRFESRVLTFLDDVIAASESFLRKYRNEQGISLADGSWRDGIYYDKYNNPHPEFSEVFHILEDTKRDRSMYDLNRDGLLD